MPKSAAWLATLLAIAPLSTAEAASARKPRVAVLEIRALGTEAHKADLVSEFVCRVLDHMDSRGYDRVEPAQPESDIDERPILDFTPGYVLRALDRLPKAGSRAPWRLKQNYLWDLRLIRHGKVDDDALRFSKHLAPVTV